MLAQSMAGVGEGMDRVAGAPTEQQHRVFRLLRDFRGDRSLKQLFWTELNYEREDQTLSRRSWNDTLSQSLTADPTLLASGGTDNNFHIIHARLNDDRLSMQAERNVITRMAQDHPYALFVFSNKRDDRWRFVNVKLDATKKRPLLRRITIGPEERLRTAAERVALLDLEQVRGDLFGKSPLAIQDQHDRAFDVEAVTKKFFEEYARVFSSVEDRIQGFGAAETERKRLFTQRLFNRLMFIAFIQKKGWMSFAGDKDYLTALRDAYRKEDAPGKNFYRDRLQLLFFSGLNAPHAPDVDIAGINRGGFLSTRIGDVPYLNGGLFEEDDDDRDATIVVPDDCLDDILIKLFDRFNFTVTESTPLDVEIAVDPEMLGKVFEELVTGRHESGSYYTPKPIVSFMGREALKGYLSSAFPNETEDALSAFVDGHDISGLREDLKAILKALDEVRICDPACGSGAYLLGMLHELLDLQSVLFATQKLEARSLYKRKLDIIQNSLYGVDLDPFAINIARLRLWLSLAVDYDDDNPPPLPNLDFKIEAGDSITAPFKDAQTQSIFIQQEIAEFFDLKTKFMSAHEGEKREIKQKIEILRLHIGATTNSEEDMVGFDWRVEFAEVFQRGGFDIVLANPPYVRQGLIREIKSLLRGRYPAVYNGSADLYCYFYARALQILRPHGMLVFISSNKWLRSNYGSQLRDYLSKNADIGSIIDFGDLPVFEGANAYPAIFIGSKNPSSKGITRFAAIKSLDAPYPDVAALAKMEGATLPKGAIAGATWLLANESSSKRFQTMRAGSRPLEHFIRGKVFRGVTTGLNEAFHIETEKRDELIRRDPRSAELIVPLIKAKNVQRWNVNPQQSLANIHPTWHRPIEIHCDSRTFV